MRVIVFVGPSLSWSEAAALCPAAELRAPARRGDFEDLGPGVVVGLIDGVFGQNLAVSPNEIKDALRRGVTVLGGSSMGALRASEVPGVEGVGTIYEMFRDGRIDRDDEVALAFDPETLAAVTEPLVNIRWAADSLARAGTIGLDTARRIIDAATGLHFTERTYRNVLRGAGIAERTDADALISLLRDRNLKRDDAQSVLERLRALHEAPPAPATEGAVAPNPYARDFTNHPHHPGGLLVWEYGDRIELRDLIDFLKLSAAIRPYAERLLARSEAVARSLATLQAAEDAFQARFDEIQLGWGWQSPEETEVTLTDLGIDLDALATALQGDETAAARVTSLVQRTDALDRELLLCVFADELALKRAALRLGALQTFAALGRRAGRPLERSEMDDARRVVCAWHSALDWAYVETRCALPRERLAGWLEEIAYARRAGRTLARIVAGHRAPRPRWKPSGSPFERRRKIPGDRRFCTPFREADAAATRIASAIGITRIGSIGELDDLGAYVVQAFGQSNWSASMGTGKSESREGARVGAVMEEVEKFAQDRFAEADGELRSTYAQLASDGSRGSVVDPGTLALPYDSRYRPDAPLAWLRCRDLVRNELVWSPAAMWTKKRLPDDPLYSARAGRKIFGTNGLAASLTLEEAVLHALCEVIERHAERLSSLKLENPGRCGQRTYPFVDLTSAPASVLGLIAKLAKAGWSLAVRDIRSEVRVPTFQVRIFRVREFEGLEEAFGGGWACHPDAEVALRMAILEAIQTRLSNVAGSREDLTIHARSLGRHERPRPVVPDDVAWYQRPRSPTRFASIRAFVSNDVAAEIDWVIGKVVRAGLERVLFVDLTIDQIRPARAVRVLVPGLEEINPFYTGPRARAAAGYDFLA